MIPERILCGLMRQKGELTPSGLKSKTAFQKFNIVPIVKHNGVGGILLDCLLLRLEDLSLIDGTMNFAPQHEGLEENF